MITGIIVVASLAFGVSFVLAWCCSRELRRWVERPKYRFLERVRRYDRARAGGARERNSTP
ncbi:MAG: hypothetical protein ACRD3C_13570 [Vicinamibacterales bacterium]